KISNVDEPGGNREFSRPKGRIEMEWRSAMRKWIVRLLFRDGSKKRRTELDVRRSQIDRAIAEEQSGISGSNRAPSGDQTIVLNLDRALERERLETATSKPVHGKSPKTLERLGAFGVNG